MKRTPWFPLTVKPARVGVYELRTAWLSIHYSKWDGSMWRSLCGSSGAANAQSQPSKWVADGDCNGWRGLTKKAA